MKHSRLRTTLLVSGNQWELDTRCVYMHVLYRSYTPLFINETPGEVKDDTVPGKKQWWEWEIRWERLPVARGGAVVQCVAGAAAAVSICYCWGDTGCWVGGKFWGGSEIPGWGGTGSGEEGRTKPCFREHLLHDYLTYRDSTLSLSLVPFSWMKETSTMYLLTWNGRLVWAMCHPHSSAQSQAPVGKQAEWEPGWHNRPSCQSYHVSGLNTILYVYQALPSFSSCRYV